MIRIKPFQLAKSYFNSRQPKLSLYIRSVHSISNTNNTDKENENYGSVSAAAKRERDNSWTGRNSKLYIYSELSKYRLSALVVVTSGAGFLCAGAPIDLCTMAAATIGTGFCAASAGTFNQIIEQVNMIRTH